MNDDTLVTTRLLVIDCDATTTAVVRQFCELHDLTGLGVSLGRLRGVLGTDVDLGGVLIPQTIDGDPERGFSVARHIQALRPELPLMLLRDAGVHGMDDLPESERQLFLEAAPIDDLGAIEHAIRASLFCNVYPHKLVRGIVEIAQQALAHQFRGMTVRTDAPCVVRDRLIHGELFTLIPLESAWCRGYLTLQAQESSLQDCVRRARTALPPEDADDFRTVNVVLGELTNLVWGAFRNRYGTVEASTPVTTEVPIVINHLHRYISFGSTDPQLNLRCTLTDPEHPQAPPVVIHLRFVFNLVWSPEDFRENEAAMNQLVATGELELF